VRLAQPETQIDHARPGLTQEDINPLPRQLTQTATSRKRKVDAPLSVQRQAGQKNAIFRELFLTCHRILWSNHGDFMPALIEFTIQKLARERRTVGVRNAHVIVCDSDSPGSPTLSVCV
jgi:hypothetical protein